MSRDFYRWWAENDANSLLEFMTMGHSEDWGEPNKSDHRTNDEKYAAKGVRSKYVAYMNSGKRKRRRKPK